MSLALKDKLDEVASGLDVAYEAARATHAGAVWRDDQVTENEAERAESSKSTYQRREPQN
jgi:hypothetical protein